MRAHGRIHDREHARKMDDSRSVEQTTSHETFERSFSPNENEPKQSDGKEEATTDSPMDSCSDFKQIASNCAYFANQLRTARVCCR